MKLSDYVMQFLAREGVRHVFMVPGGGAMHLVDSLGHCDGLEFICNLHEQACAVAAEAYARVTNTLGVALVTTGPGGTNAVTGVAAAWLDSTPTLFISGQVKRADLKGESGVRQLGVQEIDIVSIVQSITKYAVTVTDPLTICVHLEKAMHEARSGRPGPVWVDIPLDVQAAEIDAETLPRWEIERAAESPGEGVNVQASQIIELLNSSQRPVILAGNGIRLAGAQEDFLRLVDLLGIPVLTTRLGVDLLASAHDLCFGMPGSIAPRGANFTLQNADWLLILGARLDMALVAYAPERLARAAKKIMVNIDPAEIRKVESSIHMPVCADAKALIAAVREQAVQLVPRDRTPWIARCRDWKTRYPFVLPEHYEALGGVSLYAFSDALSDVLGSDAVILPGSAGNTGELFLTAFRVKAGQRVFHNKGTGAMGLAQPAAIGACVASGGRSTICIDGDGGFQMNIQELETVRRLGLPIVFFVVNNKGYASIRASQGGYFGRLTGADDTSGLTLPDVMAVAAAFGLNTARIVDQRDLRGQIERILAMSRPLVCEVVAIPDEPRAPRVASVKLPDGSMVSKPLEDMWPYLDREEFLANMMIDPVEL